MTITTINIGTPRNAVFSESKCGGVSINYNVISDTNNFSSNNNTLDNFSFSERDNNKLIKLIFSYDMLIFNKINATKNRFDESNKSYLRNESIEPFIENERVIKNYDSNLVVKNIGSLNSTNGNVLYNKVVNNPFYDKTNPVHSNNLLLEDFDHPEFDYTFSFNYSNFYFRGGRIDAFSNISKIKRSEDSISNLKGLREKGLGKGKSAFKLNNVIQQYYKKNDSNTFHFEDSIDSVYLTNNTLKKVLQRLNYVWNADTGEYTEDSNNLSVFKQVHSNEARYFAFSESNMQPFKDKTQGENYSWIANNIYRFTDDDINNKILSNKSKNDNIIEDIIYSSHGKDINKEYSSGRDSIGFYESID